MASSQKGAGKAARKLPASRSTAKAVGGKSAPAKRRRGTKSAPVAVPPEIDNADDLLPDEGLTWRQKMFVEAYLGQARLNATEAARIAGYAETTRESLAVQGYRLLMNANVQSRVRARLNQIAPTKETLLERIGFWPPPLTRQHLQPLDGFALADPADGRQLRDLLLAGA